MIYLILVVVSVLLGRWPLAVSDSEGVSMKPTYEQRVHFRRSMAGTRAQAVGRVWEDEIAAKLKRLGDAGFCAWDRTPEAMRKIKAMAKGTWLCAPDGKGPTDFMVLRQGVSMACEAKHTDLARWSFSDLADHQAQRLDAQEAHGGRGAILLLVKGKMLVLPWSVLGSRWWAWRGPVTVPRKGKPKSESPASISALDAGTIGYPFDGAGRWMDHLIARSVRNTP